MKSDRHQSLVWGIWGLLIAFAALQLLFWFNGSIPAPVFIFNALAFWSIALALAALATRRTTRLVETLADTELAHTAARSEVEQLRIQNAILEVVARSVDVPLAFQALAQRIAPLVPCDRVGLTLLNERGDEFETYTARVQDEERRARPRPEVSFRGGRTAIGEVVRSRTPMLIGDTRTEAADFLDMNVLRTSGFVSVLMLPLVARSRAVGTLNVVSRRPNAFAQEHIDVLLPIAEIFAVAYVAQQLQTAATKQRAMETMSELTLAVSADINSALQTIVGHCDLLERGYPDPNLQRDLAMVVLQAQKIATLLERMRVTSRERLREAAATAAGQGIPSSPEGFGA